MRARAWRLSRASALGDTFGHRIERIHAASRLAEPEVLDELLVAFRDESDPATRKLLALAAFRVSRATGRSLDADTTSALEGSLRWTVPG